MNPLFQKMASLESAEEFLVFFGVDFDQAVVNVSRLHILQRFHQYLRQTRDIGEMAEVEQRDACRALLARAYQDFVDSSAVKEKVFKVFRDAAGMHTVSLDKLRTSLPARGLKTA